MFEAPLGIFEGTELGTLEGEFIEVEISSPTGLHDGPLIGEPIYHPSNPT